MTEPTAPLVELTEAERELAWSRWLVLAPTVEEGVPLTRSAWHAGVPVSTARRCLTRYRSAGLAGLARCSRSDRGHRRTGPSAFRDRFELAYRRQAERPNEIWQADHTELDLLVLDLTGSPLGGG